VLKVKGERLIGELTSLLAVLILFLNAHSSMLGS
jgi:hypothetical protein